MVSEFRSGLIRLQLQLNPMKRFTVIVLRARLIAAHSNFILGVLPHLILREGMLWGAAGPFADAGGLATPNFRIFLLNLRLEAWSRLRRTILRD